ncbi:hypothetical protein CAOG_009666 [Capsaspora owczarzaki ATCC 30864]|uniref:Uncharacterized protein n=1 Tax=Capsaspora owczarzaki (strain ATCC 30864) TaxID=595528 RepID=A0A0D2VPQ6_CAPO3|nr:hypothetical protein CAOG_009666 [Capsaspora owczarzaki ATCC 30864]
MDEFAPRRPTRRPRARSTLELSLPALPHCSHRRPEPEPEPEPRRTQVRSSHPTTIPSQCSRSAAIKRPGIAPTSRPPHPSTDQPRIDVAGRSDMAFQGVRGPVVENSLETRSTRRPNHRAATLKPAAQLAWMAVALAMLMLMLLAFAESSGVRAAAVQSDDHSSQNRAAAAGIQPRDSSDSSVVDNDADVDTVRGSTWRRRGHEDLRLLPMHWSKEGRASRACSTCIRIINACLAMITTTTMKRSTRRIIITSMSIIMIHLKNATTIVTKPRPKLLLLLLAPPAMVTTTTTTTATHTSPTSRTTLKPRKSSRPCRTRNLQKDSSSPTR